MPKINGRVLNHDNDPVGSILLLLKTGKGTEVSEANTGPDGSFEFMNVKPGRYIIQPSDAAEGRHAFHPPSRSADVHEVDITGENFEAVPLADPHAEHPETLELQYIKDVLRTCLELADTAAAEGGSKLARKLVRSRIMQMLHKDGEVALHYSAPPCLSKSEQEKWLLKQYQRDRRHVDEAYRLARAELGLESAGPAAEPERPSSQHGCEAVSQSQVIAGPAPEDQDGDDDRGIDVLCSVCQSRYYTQGTMYYMNSAALSQCMNNPMCTPG